MAVVCTIKTSIELTGLGKDISLSESFDVTTAATAATYNYRVLATADTAELLDLGDVSTVELIWIKAVSGAIDIDCDFSSSFDADISIAEGEVHTFKPAGTVYVKNNGAAETPSYEYVVVGTT